MRDDCLDNPERRHNHRCPYYDHDIYSCDRPDCAHHDDEDTTPVAEVGDRLEKDVWYKVEVPIIDGTQLVIGSDGVIKRIELP